MNRDVWIYLVDGETYTLVRGQVGGWFRNHGIPAYRTNIHNGWWLRTERVTDTVALMEHTGKRPNLRRHPAPPYVPPAAITDDLAA